MGAGNWIPPNSENSIAAYIEPEKIYGNYDLDEGSYACGENDMFRHFSLCKREILSLLPDDFRTIVNHNSEQSNQVHPDGFNTVHPLDRHASIWAANDNLQLVAFEDDYNRLHLAFVLINEEPSKSFRDEQLAFGSKIIDQIHGLYGPLRVRDGAWMSKDYVPVAA